MSYWEDRSLQIKANQLKNAKQYERELKQRFESVESEITDLIDKFVKKYAKAHVITVPEAQALIDKDEVKTWNETLDKWKSMADSPEYEVLYEKYMEGEFSKSRITRLEVLRQQMTDLLASYTSNEVNHFSDKLEQSHEDTYYQTTYSIQNGLGTYTADFQKLNPNLLKSVISQNWQGSNFSKRLWGNMVNTLPSYLEKSLFTGAALGYDSRQMVNQAKQVFRNVKNKDIHRLIVTEIGHIDETATESAYKEQDVKKYRYLATLEARTCSICGELDHQVFKVSEIERGINYPLIHPHCRCTTAPYFEGMDDIMSGKRWSRNLKNVKREEIDSVSYKEWKKQFVELTDNEKAAINKYIGFDSYIINEKLRNNIKLTQTDKNFIHNLDSALDKLPNYHGTIFRSFNFINENDFIEFMSEHKVGDVVNYSAYTSASPKIYDVDAAIQVKVVDSHNAKNMIKYNRKEQEVLYKRNAEFEVIRRYIDKNGLQIIEVRELGRR